MSSENVFIGIITEFPDRITNTAKRNIHRFPKIQVLEPESSPFDMKIINKGTFNAQTLQRLTCKVNAFKKQIEYNYPYMVLLEDNLILKEDFLQFIDNIIKYIDLQDSYSIVRLGLMGKGYLTTLPGAVKIINYINNKGLTNNIDSHLGLLCSNLTGQLCIHHECWN
jgi:hypothetical protein